MKILIFGTKIESEDITLKLNRICVKSGNSNEYITTFDIEQFPKSVLFDKPDLIIVTADGEYGRDCVSLAYELGSNIPIFWFSNDLSYSTDADNFRCTYFAKKPVFSKTLLSAMQRMETITPIRRLKATYIDNGAFARMVS